MKIKKGFLATKQLEQTVFQEDPSLAAAVLLICKLFCQHSVQTNGSANAAAHVAFDRPQLYISIHL